MNNVFRINQQAGGGGGRSLSLSENKRSITLARGTNAPVLTGVFGVRRFPVGWSKNRKSSIVSCVRCISGGLFVRLAVLLCLAVPTNRLVYTKYSIYFFCVPNSIRVGCSPPSGYSRLA